MKLQHYIILSVLLISGMAGCKKSDNNLAVPDTAINFFNTAEGIFSFPGVKAVYVDVIDTAQSSPIRFTGKSTAGETFPSLAGTGPGGTVPVLYMNQTPGTHRFIFTNGNKQTVADTTFTLKEGAKNTFYAYDDPDRLLYHCRILHIEENQTAALDKCQFRILHLSSDLGDMNCYFILEDGSRIFPANLPVNMKYGTYTDFIAIDEQAIGQDGNAYLQFFEGTDTATVKATATIPYRKGRNYATVVSGLTNTKFLQYTDPVTGSTRSVQLNPSISARVRVIN